MKTCKDCIGYDFCPEFYKYREEEIKELTEGDVRDLCECFKDSSKFIELPCSIGNTSYAIAYEKENKLLPIYRGDCGATTEEEALKKFGIVKKTDEEKTSELLKDLKYSLFTPEFVSDEEAENKLQEVNINAKNQTKS